ncbi:MAG: hypothetical protein AAGG00_05275 [Cyanobacteria bacterium P01_H01_bin.150]
MFKKSLLQVLILPLAFFISNHGTARALPGQPMEEVETWIKAHPTLSPRSGERFLVTKTDTPAQRYSFQAMVSAPGKLTFSNNRNRSRTERISIYDAINGMSVDKLKESLRRIYGLDIYQDFKRAKVIYEYPSRSTINAARFAGTPIQEALKGELRLGSRYAYWVEVAHSKNGKAFTGQMTVFLKSDLDKLEEELQNR